MKWLKNITPENTLLIAVGGQYNAPLDAFIRTICTKTVHVYDRTWSETEQPQPRFTDDPTYYANPLGIVPIDEDCCIMLRGMPGGMRRDLLFDTGAWAGTVVMVQAHQPHYFRDASTVWHADRNDVSTLMVPVEMNHSDAWDVNDLRIAFRLKAHENILPCDVNQLVSVRLVLGVLLDMIEGHPLKQRAIAALAHRRTLTPDLNPA